ncbi:DUF6519 domain-containing protein [Silvibacterium acidisoli]|uniref:DUF6519 domain-containing protein n=1 Tax=Acidobacteriaceae bacterium ZG23-2 TaxID=2883246 RepID=UPI00406CBA14
MKGDFSRIRFNPGSHYTAVLEQQGRVALDADANERSAIQAYLRKTETIDVVGEYGAPADVAGFAITLSGTTIVIGAGRYYVQGLLCENSQDGLAYGSQPYLIHPSVSDGSLIGQLAQSGGAVQVFLEVWQRVVTALDDACLREPALGQADSTARLQTVWRVVAEYVQPASGFSRNAETAAGHRLPLRPLQAASIDRSSAVKMQAALRQKTSSVVARQRLAATLAGIEAERGTLASSASEAPAATVGPNVTADCCSQMYAATPFVSTGTMCAATNQGASDCSCQPVAAAGYQGLENQLYRVEIHRSGDELTAMFKWSRENASVVTAINSVNGATVWVDSLGPDANLGFQVNQWVEVYDDSAIFGQIPNQPGLLYQILSIDPTGPSVTFTSPVVGVDTSLHARMRRWDQSGGADTMDGIPLPVNSWATLENGIQVSFGAGTYQAGDYWTIPARTASGTIEWPPCGSDGSLYQPAHANPVYRAPLACIHWSDLTGAPLIESCRRIFYPLTSLAPGASQGSIHISAYSWQNDDVMTFDQLLASGLSLTVDQLPTSPLSGSSMIVSIETVNTSILSSNNQEARAAASNTSAKPLSTLINYAELVKTLPLLSSILDWDLSLNISTMQIQWMLPSLDLDGVRGLYLQMINQNLLGLLATFGLAARARVKLLGSAIFAQNGNNTAYLDGESAGIPSLQQDGKTPCIALQMPSGSGRKTSDFEGWFYLAPYNDVVNLSMNATSLTIVLSQFGTVSGVVTGDPPQAVTPQLTVQLTYPAALAAGAAVDLSLTAITAGVNPGSYVSLETTRLLIPKGQDSGAVNLNVFGNPGEGNTYNFQVAAVAEFAFGSPVTKMVTFSLIGVQGGISVFPIGRAPIIPVL